VPDWDRWTARPLSWNTYGCRAAYGWSELELDASPPVAHPAADTGKLMNQGDNRLHKAHNS
jgi:hypothetical protein